ncbi:MAG TPA: GNAT family N-acetyltransferase [Bacteroidia bacterium]|jgi:ribosomal-protein-alanine N-acetyltransferase|nr:GNAT family N-acetyltransferase [Bacteroidia bacterium]
MISALQCSVFEAFPVLETERLVLRALSAADTTQVFRLYSNPGVMQYRGAACFQTEEEAVNLIGEFEEQFAAGKGIRWGLAFKDQEQELLGTAGLKSIHPIHLRGEIGYELDPVYWNRGLMTEALRTITNFCFHTLHLHTIEANIAPDNMASERVLQKLGFVKEAHFRENWYYEGWWDSVIYSLREPG